MLEQPRGIVTLFFSDIEGSTALLQRLGVERYERALEQQRRLLREAFRANGGYEVSCEGDSFFVAFEQAAGAVEAAAAAQRALSGAQWPDEVVLRVRMGIHTGRPRVAPPQYVGLDVHQAARVMDAAHGGQVLLSEATAALSDGQTIRDLGVHRLKDLSVPQRLFQLAGDGLQERFPPPRTLASRPNNLPDRLTPLIGRTIDVTEITELLDAGARLVTLVGTGGLGKTRLSLEVAHRQLDAFPDGVYFVELVAVVEPDLVLAEIARTIGLLDTSQAALVSYLGKKRILVVADNLEQVPTAGAFLADLLTKTANLAVLATSRTPLRVRGERMYAVPTLREHAATSLFVQRAVETNPSFTLTGENAAAVAEICARLDRLPLAIELAATRTALLEPIELLRRLDSRLDLLTGGLTDLPARHQTLRRTLAWSFDLVDTPEQELFARLSVFAGGFTLEAEEAVTRATIDELGALVDASLVRKENGRFGMLETVREFAQERLRALGLADDAHERHVRYFEAFAEAVDVLPALHREFDNFRAALDWLAAQDGTAARRLRLATSLIKLWETNALEGLSRLESALAEHPARDDVRARAVLRVAELFGTIGQCDAAVKAGLEAVEIATQLGHSEVVAAAWDQIRWAYVVVGDVAGARAAIDRQIEAASAVDDPLPALDTEFNLLHAYVWSRELTSFERLAPRALAHAQRLGARYYEGVFWHLVGEAALATGDPASAKAAFQRRLAFLAPAEEQFEEAVTLEGVAMSLAGEGEDALALRIGGAAAAQFEAWAIPADSGGSWDDLRRQYYGGARTRLGRVAAAAAWEAGAAMSLAEAVALALES